MVALLGEGNHITMWVPTFGMAQYSVLKGQEATARDFVVSSTT